MDNFKLDKMPNVGYGKGDPLCETITDGFLVDSKDIRIMLKGRIYVDECDD